MLAVRFLEYHDHKVAARVNYADGTPSSCTSPGEDRGQTWVVRALDRSAQ